MKAAAGEHHARFDQAQWSQALRAAGLRVTRQRLAVLAAVVARPHGTIEEILDEVRTELPTITIQSVYFVMNSLVSAEIVRKLEFPGSPARYEVEGHDNHHHAVCRYCGRIEDVACVTGQAPCLQPEAHVEMTVEVAEVIFTAVCHDCAATQRVRM
ncbi:MAG TPA: Fur family transcriptional regulator [Enteractinococcus sp.]